MSLDNRWLLSHAANHYSQNGEDGIIEKILEVLGEPIGWCVEFGAWDGRHLSNTYALIEEKDFSAVLIEGSTERYLDLKNSFSGNDKITPVNAFVGFTSDDGLDWINFLQTPISRENSTYCRLISMATISMSGPLSRNMIPESLLSNSTQRFPRLSSLSRQRICRSTKDAAFFPWSSWLAAKDMNSSALLNVTASSLERIISIDSGSKTIHQAR